LADEAGRLVVEPSFREIQGFGPNLLAGASDRDGRYGFINLMGAWSVPPVFGQVEPFAANGLAPARRVGEERWGYINAAGEFVIPPVYEQAFTFDGDRARVRSEDGLYSLINPKGQPVGTNKFAHLGDFDPGGLAPAQKDPGGLFGLVNRKGVWAVPPRFEMVFGFNGSSLAPAQQDGLYGFINRNGQWVIKPVFGNVDDFETRLGRAPAEQSGAWGLIDSGGNWVVGPEHLLLLNAGNGAPGPIQVFAGNGRWGLMDENGRWLMEPILNASPYFAANGLSEARVGSLYGFIDRFGNWMVEPAFQQVGAFRRVPSVPPALSPSVAEKPGPSAPAGERTTTFSVDSGAAEKAPAKGLKNSGRPAAPPEVKAVPPGRTRRRNRPEPASTSFVVSAYPPAGHGPARRPAPHL